jgi:hypothetical protein
VATRLSVLALGHEQDAVEVVADVVHRHGKRHLAQQVLQRLLRHAEHGAEVAASCTSGKSSAGRVCSVKRLLPPFRISLDSGRFQAHRLVAGHGAQDVDELACAHGGGEVARVATQLGGGADLDFEVAGGQLHRIAGLADQHVGQDGQRVPALHDAATDCSTASTLSCVAFRTIMSQPLVVLERTVRGQQRRRSRLPVLHCTPFCP